MPSLRKRVSSYFRQLSFHNETKEKRNNLNENTFVTKYLQGRIGLKEGPAIIYGKNPTDLPNYELGKYESGPNTVIGCYSGPNGGLTTVKRIEKHLSVPDDDIDYIDTHDEEAVPSCIQKKSPKRIMGYPIDNATMVIKVAGHEYCVTNKPKRHSKSLSLGSISDVEIEIEKTKIEKSFNNSDKGELNEDKKCSDVNDNHNCDTGSVKRNNEKNGLRCVEDKYCDKSGDETNNKTNQRVNEHKKINEKRVVRNEPIKKVEPQRRSVSSDKNSSKNYALSKSKSEGNPFHNKRRGKIIKIERPNLREGDSKDESEVCSIVIDDSTLPEEWNRKSELFYGLSDSLYDRNQVTRNKNGDPIADCFGIVARNDSAILAVADGVNWGEKASIAAKSAIHGCLHYLSKTIFNDTKLFENLTIKTDDASTISSLNPDKNLNLISNTREVFVCLLRAFNCAHDLILENKGMLTTLTVAVVLPLKQKPIENIAYQNENIRRQSSENRYICCVCNVGDTLAYVYSQRYGVRELTKGSHDVNSNRDMRDALGALGPVDGINPELSNLTLSITTLQKGDIIMVASDGLTDNFDPNVCRFTVNSDVIESVKTRRPSTSRTTTTRSTSQPRDQLSHPPKPVAPKNVDATQKPPVKPPRRSKNRGSIKSNTLSERSTSSSIENEAVDKNEQGDVLDTTKCDDLGSDTFKKEADVSLNINPSRNFSNHENISSSNVITNKQGSDKNSYGSDTCGTELKMNNADVDYDNPLVAQFMRENSLDGPTKNTADIKKPVVVENKASSLRRQASSQVRRETTPTSRKVNSSKTIPINKTIDYSKKQSETVGYKFLKSKTSLDLRSAHTKQHILRNEDGIPYITPIQRYELQLLLIEDILKHGISGRDSPCTSAKKLCENLVSFTMSITSAKRHTLEDQDLYFDNRNGLLVEVSTQEKKLRRKKGLERVQNLPGKLDHVTVVAYNVGNFAY